MCYLKKIKIFVGQKLSEFPFFLQLPDKEKKESSELYFKKKQKLTQIEEHTSVYTIFFGETSVYTL